jgi:hypothetical protein
MGSWLIWWVGKNSLSNSNIPSSMADKVVPPQQRDDVWLITPKPIDSTWRCDNSMKKVPLPAVGSPVSKKLPDSLHPLPEPRYPPDKSSAQTPRTVLGLYTIQISFYLRKYLPRLILKTVREIWSILWETSNHTIQSRLSVVCTGILIYSVIKSRVLEYRNRHWRIRITNDQEYCGNTVFFSGWNLKRTCVLYTCCWWVVFSMRGNNVGRYVWVYRCNVWDGRYNARVVV